MDIEYEPVWSGAMEAAGEAQGLSRCEGNASLHQSGAWVYAEDPSGGDDAPRPAPAARTFWDQSRDPEAVTLLLKGVSLARAAAQLGTTKDCIRRVAIRRGVTLSGPSTSAARARMREIRGKGEAA